MTKSEALDLLEQYLKERDVDECKLLTINDKHTFFEVQSLEPYGVFFIDKIDGEVVDNYGVFEK